MDDNYSGDSFGGFFQNGSARRSITFDHDNTSTADVEINAPKKKRVSRMTGGGLRQFSAIVCDLLESKGRTTYAELADYIMSELAGNDNETATSLSEFNDKNIPRRVYDALNVLEALDIITRVKKEIKWNGIPDRKMNLEGMKAECDKMMNRIGRKTAYLKDLEEQFADLQNLMYCNKELLKSGNSRPGGFLCHLYWSSRDATVEIEISEDKHMVHFDFNSAPFFLHDDTYILKLLRFRQPPERTNVSQNSSVYPPSPCPSIVSGGARPFYWNSGTETPNAKLNKC
ncbi:transcription factor-like protein DPA [Prunus yedoensis var. nudiflora]|uniref:Transcription factor-like protein DPA n=1 Tax=Prunus yedoensis var. nudiflora TaxID=2094558 RepID=A0A314UJ21_PRUYE|nr:transcription factor-like protein DPA [Prunus yedoensis var. nudiflora]